VKENIIDATDPANFDLEEGLTVTGAALKANWELVSGARMFVLIIFLLEG
jgi:hypothetical protein